MVTTKLASWPLSDNYPGWKCTTYIVHELKRASGSQRQYTIDTQSGCKAACDQLQGNECTAYEWK